MHLSGRLYVLMNGREPWKFKEKLLNEESIWGIDTASDTKQDPAATQEGMREKNYKG